MINWKYQINNLTKRGNNSNKSSTNLKYYKISTSLQNKKNKDLIMTLLSQKKGSLMLNN